MFHWKDGWWFNRLENGTVVIEHKEVLRIDGTADLSPLTGEVKFTQPDVHLEIPDGEWASIIASVSHTGEIPGRWGESLEFHNGDKF